MSSHTTSPTVRITHGLLQGTTVLTAAGEVQRYAGVPYAAAPLGDRRFRAPARAAAWDGVCVATTFGPDPMQAMSGPFSGAVPGMAITAVDEDCLTLNVWTPAAAPDEQLPVMVWVAGGAFVVGGTSQPTYDAARLAAEQRVVVITVNYRVGCFGFLDLREVPGGDTADTNCGLHDLALALAWAGENAAAFGGDPDRITVFGESAGAGLIMHLLTTPGVGGLVRGAIAQSPGIDFTQRADTSAAVATALLARVGVRTVRELRELPAVALLDAQTTVAADLLFDIGTMVFHPVVDDAFVTETPSVALAGGAAADVALLLGHTTDELRLFLDPRPNRMDRAALGGWVRSYLTARMGRDPGHSVADTLIGRYLDAASATTRSRGADVWSALQTDATMRQPVIRVADSRDSRAAATFVAQFGWQSQSADGVDRGAFHAIDLPFVFDNFDAGWAEFIGADDTARQLGRSIRAAWAAFAATRDPSCPALGTWPRYNTVNRSTMVLDAVPSVVDDPLAEQRGWWAGLWHRSCRPAGVPR